jgi:acyl phosphate:glycerol-3-phosphate acyltransferase
MMESGLAVVAAYLLGSMPFGFWIGRLMGHDLRVEGSGNTGATNALRVLGKEVGILVMVLDIGKGTLAVVIASQLGGTGTEVLAATAAVLGHAFPVFLRFRGGKAVATGAGAMLGLAPITAVIAFTVWIAVIGLTRYVSLASLIAAVLFPILAIAFDEPWPVIAFTLCAASFVFWRHRANIARLRAGKERRLSLRGAR